MYVDSTHTIKLIIAPPPRQSRSPIAYWVDALREMI